MLLYNLLQQTISLWAVKEKAVAVLQSIQDTVKFRKVASVADIEIEAVATRKYVARGATSCRAHKNIEQ